MPNSNYFWDIHGHRCPFRGNRWPWWMIKPPGKPGPSILLPKPPNETPTFMAPIRVHVGSQDGSSYNITARKLAETWLELGPRQIFVLPGEWKTREPQRSKTKTKKGANSGGKEIPWTPECMPPASPPDAIPKQSSSFHLRSD